MTQVLAEVVRVTSASRPRSRQPDVGQTTTDDSTSCRTRPGLESFDRLVRVDQRPIGRTPRSNLATYTGMFDAVRKLYAATDEAAGARLRRRAVLLQRAEGRCETCQGEGFVAVELLFLPGTYAPCPTCHGARYNAETLEVTYRGQHIADVLAMSVDEPPTFLADVPAASRSLETLRDVGPGLPAARAAGDGAQRRGGPAHQARHRAPAGPPRARALPARRADRGSAPCRRRAAAAPAAPASSTPTTRWCWSSTTSTSIATADWVIDLGPGGGDGGRPAGGDRNSPPRSPDHGAAPPHPISRRG